MKKIFTLIAVCACMLSASAQTSVSGSKFLDNWSIGLDGGISTNIHDWDAPNGGVVGLQLTKGVTPVVSFELAAQLGFNDNANWNLPHSSTVVDNVTAMASTKINLMNWIGGYKGQPRLFEIQARGGVGYMRSFYTSGDLKANDFDHTRGDVLVKLGLDFDFNLGQEKAWTISLRPAVVMTAHDKEEFHGKALTPSTHYGDNVVGQLTAGFAYHFKNSNGKHYFTPIVARSQAEIDALMAQINDARELAEREREEAIRIINGKDQEIEDLKQKLADCEGRAPEVSTEKSMECYVYFKQGRSTIEASQQPNVERIATFLKNHNEAKVVINGYASPEGSIEVNERLAQQRADAVKTSLVNKYHIAADRIEANGKGVGDAFSEPDWNRVSICTIEQEEKE